MDAPNQPMTTRVLPYGEAAIAESARLILAGDIVAVPTETVYGLAADAPDSLAVARIYAAKGRPSFNPLIVHVLDLAAAETLAEFDDLARELAARYWPGPLTLVLPLKHGAPIAPSVTAGLPTIALRVPAHRAMRALLSATGKPLAAPSANASNAISPTRAEHILASLSGRVPLVIDDGATDAGLESTIVRTGAEPAILRPGPITLEMLLPRASSERRPGPHEARAGQESQETLAFAGVVEMRVTAPGQLASHYSPSKPLRLNADSAAPDEWLIGFGPVLGDDTLSIAGDLTEAASRLFAALHRADASPRQRIAVAPIPEHGIGAAINDRLRRAAHI
ncbi:L-threonylcarbamoyladenylate synthase [soil metagenome]